jgi:hypothetical protein
MSRRSRRYATTSYRQAALRNRATGENQEDKVGRGDRIEIVAYWSAHHRRGIRKMASIRACVIALLSIVAASPLAAQRPGPPSPSSRVHSITHDLLQSNKELGTMGRALIDTPDWQVATNLRGISERVINHCMAIDDLLQVQEMVSDLRDRAKVHDFIRDQVRRFYGTLIDEEVSGIIGEKARAKSSGLASAAEALSVQLMATKDSLLVIVRQ